MRKQLLHTLRIHGRGVVIPNDSTRAPLAPRPWSIMLLFLFMFLQCIAQTEVTGLIIEQGSNEPLVGASVILRNPEGKIKKYATSDANGNFHISATTIVEHTLDVSMLSFAKQTFCLDSITLPITIEMIPETTMLKEVSVKADRIREQGDTISYLVGSFAQAQDHSIGDVLNRMPGIDVSDNGRIQYQGEDINKLYIEGSDLLGGKYGVATNGISHEDVGAVEVMENHQPMQVLSGISFSDKAIIPVYLADRYEKMSRVDLWKAKRAFEDNPIGNIMAQTGNAVKIEIKDENGKNIDMNESFFVSRDKIDFLETDY